MRLFICEKPSQAKDIATVLGITQRGDGYIAAGTDEVTWCIGHLLEQDEPDSYNADYKQWNMAHLPIIPDPWKLHVKSEVKEQYNTVTRRIKKADSLVVATDADREGENIAWEIIERSGFKGEIKRLWLSALDESNVRKGLGSMLPGEKTKPYYYAALGRQRADWLVGMNLTRAFTLLGQRSNIQGVLSVGRVQTPTLALIVNRDHEIKKFMPKPFYVNWIELDVDGHSFKATIDTSSFKEHDLFDEEGRCLSEELATKIQQNSQETAQVIACEYKQSKSSAPLPFSLSALQQTANKLWGYGAQEVLEIAQALYETHKLTTYPRSDCQYLPVDQLSDADAIMGAIKSGNVFSEDRLDEVDTSIKSRAWNDDKVTAHHAMIPTTTSSEKATLKENEQNIYTLICKHYVAQFMPPYEFLKSSIKVDASRIKYGASGETPIAPGWKKLIQTKKADDNQTQLPRVSEGDHLKIMDSGFDAKKTSAPKRFTEGTLVAAMSNIQRFIENESLKAILKETEGIGTEATRASIIETLFQRKFIKKKGKQIESTELGQQLIALLPRELKEAGTTALMERMLGQIAEGEVTLDAFMQRQIKWLSILVNQTRERFSERPAPDHSSQGASSKSFGTCPECNKGELHQRKGKFGSFVGCSNYPDCKFILKGKVQK